MKIILKPDQREMLGIGSKLIDKDGNTWCYLPYWFKINPLTEEAEIFSFEKLPEHIKEQLQKLHE